jgi:hypothetical protein
MSTATLFNGMNLYAGIREFSQVTNTYGGYLTSGGHAYNLLLPFFAHKLEWVNFTKWATNSNNISGVWYRDMPAANDLIITRGTTTLTSTLEATNGVTDASTPAGFAKQQLVITGITGPATPPVVTTLTNHNLTSGDRVVITKVVGTMAAQINNFEYSVQVLSPTTFGLYDFQGNPIAVLGSYTSGGSVTKDVPALGLVGAPSVFPAPVNGIQNYPEQNILTLGTAIMGAASDVIYFTATRFNSYQNLGTVP